ncbi:hypothetical protein ACWEPN_36850 [Nonomuraea wenchangensis]
MLGTGPALTGLQFLPFALAVVAGAGFGLCLGLAGLGTVAYG